MICGSIPGHQVTAAETQQCFASFVADANRLNVENNVTINLDQLKGSVYLYSCSPHRYNEDFATIKPGVRELVLHINCANGKRYKVYLR